mmetsp:Transcript_11391/g.34373  ORF Transcript_11391/g.34373 Transcript_11391/m.34373 type:complete len:282 (-) Transcript_11391:38-883(-)
MASLIGGDALVTGKDRIEGLCLLVIDPQNDFHAGGSLAVPGAEEDCARTAAFLRKNGDKISSVVITLDTHHTAHVAHPAFWERATDASARPDPFTVITSKDIEAGTWRARDPALRAWALEYARKLEAGGRFALCVWPEHCLLGTEGHAVSAPLKEAALDWARRNNKTVAWLLKGMNNKTEMYSCFSAEVPVAEDPATSLNAALIAGIARHDKVVCCGQAKSHCVNYSVRDLLAAWPADKPKSDVVLLNDATSPVPGFEAAAEQFEAYLREAGATVSTTDAL